MFASYVHIQSEANLGTIFQFPNLVHMFTSVMATLVGKPITSNGLGLMSMCDLYNECFAANNSLGLTQPQDPVSDEIAFPVLKAALACGANVWNGADFYGTEEANSLHLLNRYFTKYPEDAEKVVSRYLDHHSPFYFIL